MAPTFGRSISFPLSPARSSKPRAPAPYHVRSISLPCRSHPLLSHLQENIRVVRSWLQDPAAPSSGLAHLHALHAALAELLLLPEARPALSSGSSIATCLLDGFLVLADAHGAFQEALLDLKAYAAGVQAALRRRDSAKLSSAVRSQRHAEKELARLAASVRGAAKRPALVGSPANCSAAEVEVAAVLTEAVAVVAFASAAVFSAVESSSAAASFCSKKTAASLMSLVKKNKPAAGEDKEMVALERLDECMAEMESGSDKVFRSILHTRVALLNINTTS